MDKKISVIIPCYRSTDFLEKTVGDITKEISGKEGYTYQIILVNDGSPDNTFDTIANLCERDKNIVGVNLTRNFGQQRARLAAFPFATGDYVVIMDDDGQHPASGIFDLVSKIDEGFDICFARFAEKKHDIVSRFGSRINRKMEEFLYDLPAGIHISSFFIVTPLVAKQLTKYNSITPAIAGYFSSFTQRITNIELTHHNSHSGKSRYSLWKKIRLALGIWVNYSAKPLTIVSVLGALLSAAGFVFGIYVVVRKIYYPENILPGYSSLLAVLLISAGLIIIILSLIGKYVINIYSQVVAIPQYVIRETINDDRDL
jgi:undecaprenyl-phosphate 4-deoxy-4-formamido-L-arabinose transferase